MARFKLVKTGKRRVEVRKVRFKVNFVVLILSLACAVLVWLYVTGRNADPDLLNPEETKESQTQSEVTESDVRGFDEKREALLGISPLYGGYGCEI